MAESIGLLVFSNEFDDYNSAWEGELNGVLTSEFGLNCTESREAFVYEGEDTKLHVFHRRGRIMTEDGTPLREIEDGRAFKGEYAFVFTKKPENYSTMSETLCNFFQQREYTRLW